MIDRVNEHVRLRRIPVFQIVRCELVVPLQFAGPGVQREHTVGVEIVAGAIDVVGIRPRVAGGPIEGVRRRVV